MKKDTIKKIVFDDCPLCKLSPAEDKIIRRQILTRNRSCEEIADQYSHLKVTPKQVNDHVYIHSIREDEENGVGIEYIYNKVTRMVTRVEDYFHLIEISDMEHGSGVRNLTSLSKELRESLKLLIELESKVGGQRQDKEFAKVCEKYERLKNILMEEACDECMDRVMKRLEQEKLL